MKNKIKTLSPKKLIRQRYNAITGITTQLLKSQNGKITINVVYALRKIFDEPIRNVGIKEVEEEPSFFISEQTISKRAFYPALFITPIESIQSDLLDLQCIMLAQIIFMFGVLYFLVKALLAKNKPENPKGE